MGVRVVEWYGWEVSQVRVTAVCEGNQARLYARSAGRDCNVLEGPATDRAQQSALPVYSVRHE